MQYISQIFLSLLMSACALQALAKSSYPGPVKYVQGGIYEEGDGSKSAPYRSLADAQADTSWKTLIVLASPFMLDGGITMRPDTNLVGELNPVGPEHAQDQPTITNSSSVYNGGNGVVVMSGNVCVENIFFKNTYASAINYDNAQDLLVENVLISGSNQAEITVALPVPRGGHSRYYIGALQSIATQNGVTELCNVVVRDDFASYGVAESVAHGVQRTFTAINVEYRGPGQLINHDLICLNIRCGILLMQSGAGSSHYASICRDPSRCSDNAL